MTPRTWRLTNKWTWHRGSEKDKRVGSSIGCPPGSPANSGPEPRCHEGVTAWHGRIVANLVGAPSGCAGESVEVFQVSSTQQATTAPQLDLMLLWIPSREATSVSGAAPAMPAASRARCIGESRHSRKGLRCSQSVGPRVADSCSWSIVSKTTTCAAWMGPPRESRARDKVLPSWTGLPIQQTDNELGSRWILSAMMNRIDAHVR